MIFIYFIAVTVVLVYVLYPLLAEAYWPFMRQTALSELHLAKKEGIWAISDVDSEYEMGKITEEDHNFLRRQLKSEVMPVIKQEKGLYEQISLNHKRETSVKLRKRLVSEVLRLCGKDFS